MLIEGFYGRDVSEPVIRDYLLGIANHVDLQTYGDPIIFAPAAGMGSAEKAGGDAFVPLIDSGISVYFWTAPKFLSVVLYTCKGFDEAQESAFTRGLFDIDDDPVCAAF